MFGTPIGTYTIVVQITSLVQPADGVSSSTHSKCCNRSKSRPRPGCLLQRRTQSYSSQLQTTGGTTGQDGAQFAWSVIAGSLPAGIALDPNTGLLSGPVANAALLSTFTVQVTDLQANVSVTRQFTIDVAGGIAITTTSLPNATLNQPYSPFQFEASNAPGYVWSVAASTPLPPGFGLSSSGVLSGVGLATGIFRFHVQLTDPQGSGQPTTSKAFTSVRHAGTVGYQETALPPGATQNVLYTGYSYGGGRVAALHLEFRRP